MNFSRREFLIKSGAVLLSAPALVKSQNKKRVLILGAGLSGLSAAYELAQRGFEVTVIEARERVGGRIHTLHDRFRDGQYVELGGELVGNSYKRYIGYIKKFNVPFEEVPEQFETSGSVSNLQGGTGTTSIFKSRLYPKGSFLSTHPYGLKGDEAKGLPPSLLSMNLRSMLREISGDYQKMLALDKISLAEAMRRRGISKTAVALMNTTLNYNSIETVSAGAIIFEMNRRSSAGSSAIRIIGGNYLYPKAIFENAEKSGVKFIFNSPVTNINHSGKTVKVTFRGKNGKFQTLEAEKIVCTIPFSVLRNIRFSPALPAQKARAIEKLPYTRITKVYMQGKRFEWDRRNIGTSVWTDTPLERIFETAGTRGDERGIFTVWMDGDGARIPDSMSDRQRQIWARANFVKIMPFMKNKIERTATKSWANDPFARGAYSHFTVGQLASLKPHLKTPIGNIHFAGEHTAEFAPGMEGALESAERVVGEITSS